MKSDSDKTIDTASAVRVKFGSINQAGKKLVICQEVKALFGDLEREGLGPGLLKLRLEKW